MQQKQVPKTLPVPHVSGSLIGKTSQDEEKQLIVVLLVGKVSGEVLLHVLHYRVLLGVNEALEHDPHGHVDIILADKLPQMHLCMRLCNPDHALDVSDSDGDGPGSHALPPQFGVHLGHLLLVHLVQLRVDLLPGVQDVLPQ